MENRDGQSGGDQFAGELYRRIRRQRIADVAEECRALGLDRERATELQAKLADLGLIRPEEPGSTVVVPVSPEMAIVEALYREKTQLERYTAELGDLHRRLAELVEEFLPFGTNGNSDVNLQVLTDRVSVTAYLDMAAALTRHEVLSMHAGPVVETDALEEGRERGRRLHERGIRLRTIYPRRLVTGGQLTQHVDDLVRVGYDIRVAETLPARTITFDERRAVLAIDPAAPDAGVLAIEGEPLVHCVVSVFEYCWLHATTPQQAQLADDGMAALSQQEQAVLRMLAAGLKDDKIARSLGVSVRTVSRIVGDLMRRLDAESRFQAGVHAVGLGWTGR